MFGYLKLTLKHKWHVYRAGRRLGLGRWQLLVHDLSKLGCSEYMHYQRRFFGDGADPDGFALAWLHHQNHNPHHWDYWITRTPHKIGTQGGYAPSVLPMPRRYAREMVADWVGAGMAYTGKMDVQPWLNANWQKMELHPQTLVLVDEALKEFGCYWPGPAAPVTLAIDFGRPRVMSEEDAAQVYLEGRITRRALAEKTKEMEEM